MNISLFEIRDKQWEKVAQELHKIKEQRRYLQGIELKLTSKLKAFSEYKSCRSSNFVFYSIEQKGSIDYKLIPELKNLNLEQYRKKVKYGWHIKKITPKLKGELDGELFNQ